MQVSRRRLLTLVASVIAACRTETLVEPSTTTMSVPATTVATTTHPPPTTTAATTTSTTTTAIPPKTIEAIERAGWGAAEAQQGMVEHDISRLTVHHTAVTLADNRQAPSRLRAHQRFHQGDRGWPDLAYHFAIDQEGNVYEGRSLEFRGDTATTYDPTGHFLVVPEGNFDEQPFPDEQLRSLVDMLAWASAEYRVAPGEIRGHRDYASTTCPGRAVYAVITDGELSELVEAAGAEGPTVLVFLRGQEALERVAEIEA